MYERMLDKLNRPSDADFRIWCGASAALLERLDGFLTNTLGAHRLLRFPYGNSYGWGCKYSIKNRHICDVFAEKGAFTVMLRLSNAQLAAATPEVSPEAQNAIAHKYPCGDGGWLHWRVTSKSGLDDALTLLNHKLMK